MRLNLLLLVLLPALSGAVEALEKTWGDPSASGYGYLLYMPVHAAKPGAKLPLVVFLHGAGERGSDVKALHKNNLPKRLDAMSDLPYVVVAPQCPAGQRWSDVKRLNAFLDHLLKGLPVDPDRVTLTGLSLGGMGTWTWGAANPERFAALAPVCGLADKEALKSLKGMPVWAFHGDKDKAVPFAAGKAAADAARAAGADVKFTTYPGVGHDSWVKAYAEPDFDSWVLSHRRAAR
ncbi:MAG: dienelactone hydrolase family protein [Opitutales bacterium]